MYECYLTFRSITPCQQAQRYLSEQHIRSQKLRTPKSVASKGCGYSLKLNETTISLAASKLSQAQIPYQRAYRIYPDGRVEELFL